MSTEKRVTFNDRAEPHVVVTIDGWHDAFRFSWALAHLQCEFADLGRRIGASLRRRLGARQFAILQAPFTAGTLTWARDEEDKPAELVTVTHWRAVNNVSGGIALSHSTREDTADRCRANIEEWLSAVGSRYHLEVWEQTYTVTPSDWHRVE